jgi:UDP-N-acetylglucosamine diphosphorylase/glucosamine-1-phosphate N-acetyltransferase
MNFILFDDLAIKLSLLPLTYTRPVAEIRIGIFTIYEKWKQYLKNPLFYYTETYLQKKFPNAGKLSNHTFINGAVCPTPALTAAILHLKSGQSLVQNDILLAYNGSEGEKISYHYPLTVIKNLWDIFAFNSREIIADFEMIRNKSETVSIRDEHTKVYHSENIFIEPGAIVKAAILNAENGPIYLGRDAQVHEGAIIRGPFALCEGATVNMGSKMRENTTIGPYSKVGGEISNSVIFGYSNKAHDGFMGNSVIGEWCNLGADTNTSNLKNNYGEVEIYNYKEKKQVKTGLQFCGLIMGDHSKCSINTMFNTGTVAGVSANIFGGGFPPKFISSFSWGGAAGFTEFDLNKAFEVAQRVTSRRNIPFDTKEREIFTEIFSIRKSFETFI